MSEIFYKGYRIHCKKDSDYIAKVIGREQGRYKGIGKTKEEAILNIKKEIDKVRK